MIWHSESTAAVLTALESDRAAGLTGEAAARRRETEDAAPQTGAPPLERRFGNQLKSPEVLALLAAALLLAGFSLYHQVTGSPSAGWWEPLAVLALTLLRCLCGVWGDGRADTALRRLETVAAPTVRVWRDGTEQTLSAAELVPGDVVELTADDRIPADCRLLESFELRCDESPLTGDTLPVNKEAGAVVSAIAPLSERVNMLYGGCVVTHGRGRAVVVEVGERTEAGKQNALRGGRARTQLPLQESLARSGQGLRWPLLLAAAVILVLALVSGETLLPALVLALALPAAALPGSLSSLAAPACAAAVRRMAARGAVVRRAGAVETLGQVSVLCTDKTGSFTRKDMTLVRAFVGDHMVKLDDSAMPQEVNALVQLAALCAGTADGDPTAAAIAAYARRHDMDPAELTAAYPRLGEVPFDSLRRRQTAIHLIEGRRVVIVQGAPEGLLPLCVGIPPELRDAEDFMEAGALRVLAVACKYIDEVPAHCTAQELERGLTFLGLLGLADPPRPEAVQAVEDCRAAGICPVMLTGDNLSTAAAVARRLNLMESPQQAVGGEELAALSDAALEEQGTQYRVCARIAPADKVRIVSAWQKAGAAVALTGDGAADIPAMRAADVGCAMRREGADVTAVAADVVLTDDRFSTLVNAVRESRAFFLNLRRTVGCWLSCHIGEVLLTAAALIGWGRSPLTAVGLLWLSVVVGATSAWALGAQPAGREVMRRPPRSKAEGLWGGGTALIAVACGALLAALAVWALALGAAVSVETGLSMALAVLSFGQISLMLCWRSPLPLVRSHPLRGWRAFAAAAGSLALLLPVWLIAPLREACGLAALTAAQGRMTALLSAMPFLLGETVKLLLTPWRARKRDAV